MTQANNVVNLTGIPVSDSPEARHTAMSEYDLAMETSKQVAELHFEVEWMHKYHTHMATLSETAGEAINMHSAVLLRQFDNRLCELESLATALCYKLSTLDEGDEP